MSYFTYSGYGYSKKLCKSVTQWFMTQYLSDQDIEISIHHRSLKSEGVDGLCDSIPDTNEFEIEIDTYLSQTVYMKTLLHELYHVLQWVNGSLHEESGKLYYRNSSVSSIDYELQPHEVEASQQEEILYRNYIFDRYELQRS